MSKAVWGQCVYSSCSEEEPREERAFPALCCAGHQCFSQAVHRTGLSSPQPAFPLLPFLLLCFFLSSPFFPLPFSALFPPSFFPPFLLPLPLSLLSLSPFHFPIFHGNLCFLWGTRIITCIKRGKFKSIGKALALQISGRLPFARWHEGHTWTMQTLHLVFCPQVLTGGWWLFFLPHISMWKDNQSVPLAILDPWKAQWGSNREWRLSVAPRM